jgi:hypothetical protein
MRAFLLTTVVAYDKLEGLQLIMLAAATTTPFGQFSLW